MSNGIDCTLNEVLLDLGFILKWKIVDEMLNWHNTVTVKSAVIP